MSTEQQEKKERIKPGQRRYSSVAEMMAEDGSPKEVREEYSRLSKDTRLTRQLVSMRIAAGLTQDQLAKLIGCGQPAISKLESGCDEELTLKDLADYAEATSHRIVTVIGPPLNPMEAVQYHAKAIHRNLRSLAKLANRAEQLEPEIRGFFSEAFFNILNILTDCSNAMPKALPAPGQPVEVMFQSHEVYRGSQMIPEGYGSS